MTDITVSLRFEGAAASGTRKGCPGLDSVPRILGFNVMLLLKSRFQKVFRLTIPLRRAIRIRQRTHPLWTAKKRITSVKSLFFGPLRPDDDGAGHGIWYYDKPMYRQEAAMDSFNKTLAFFDRHLKP